MKYRCNGSCNMATERTGFGEGIRNTLNGDQALDFSSDFFIPVTLGEK